jgi:YD repeat-containing protein
MSRTSFRVFCALLSLIFLALHPKPSHAVDTSLPYWQATGSIAINGDGPALGEFTALQSFYHYWPGYGPPTNCYLWGNGSFGECDLARLYGQSSLKCPFPTYKKVGSYCIKDGDFKQPPCVCQVTVGNPVIIATGMKTEIVADYTTAGPQSLDFAREYVGNIRQSVTSSVGSARATDTSRFGLAWRTKYDSGLLFSSATPAVPANDDRSYLLMPDGNEIAFIYSSSLSKWRPAYYDWSASAWKAPRLDIDMSFELDSSEARVIYKNGDVWAYQLNGLLKEIRYKSGYTQTLTYTGINNTSITDNLGRSLTFTYDARNLLASMTTPDGKIYKYTYLDPVSVPQNDLNYLLKEVILPDNTPLVDTDNPKITYHYEDPNTLHALTGITDERGVRYATWSYDLRGRVLTSSHAGGADNYTFAYDDVNNKRTVTNPLGKQTVYHFQMVHGMQRLIQVEGIASSNCAASDTTYTYDTTGYVNQTTDGEGRITKYTNNSRGLPLTTIEGFGTPEARTTTITWHANLNKPTQIVGPRLTSDFVYDVAGNLTSLTQTDTTTHTLPYSTNGQTMVWTYSYSPQGLLLTVNGPLSGASDRGPMPMMPMALSTPSPMRWATSRK